MSGLLTQEHPDADTLAEEIIRTIDDKRAKEERWVVIYQWQREGSRMVTITYGPYTTRKRAEKVLGDLVSPGEPLAKAMICKLFGEVYQG